MKVLAIVLVMVGCGAQEKTPSNPVSTALETSASTPADPPAQGPAGPAGPAGPMGPQGPKGDKGDTGRDGAAGKDGQAGAAGKDGIDGTNGQDGAQGPVGATGATGNTGPVGATGAVGPTGAAGATGARGAAGSIGLFNAQNQEIGYVVDPWSTMVMLASGAYFFVDIGTGNWQGTVGWNNVGTSNIGAVCQFQSADCSGPCYMSGSNGYPITIAAQNAAVFDGHDLWTYQGTEPDVGSTQFHSQWSYQGVLGCKTVASTLPHAWLMTHKETLPNGLSMPLGLLHFGATPQ